MVFRAALTSMLTLAFSPKVGGGPTGVEYAAELHDFLLEDLTQWYPEIAGKIKITLVEALPSVLPMFSKVSLIRALSLLFFMSGAYCAF